MGLGEEKEAPPPPFQEMRDTPVRKEAAETATGEEEVTEEETSATESEPLIRQRGRADVD